MLKKIFRGWTGGRILPVFLFLLAALTMVRAQTASTDPVEAAVLHRLRQLCVENPSLRGVYLTKADSSKKGTLIVEGIVDHKDQAKLLATEGKKAIAEVVAWKTQYPTGVQMGTFKEFPIRSQYLNMIKKELLQTPDEADRRLFSQTRIDDVYYDPATGKLTFAGVVIAKDAKDQVDTEPDRKGPIRKGEEKKADTKKPDGKKPVDPKKVEPKKGEQPPKREDDRKPIERKKEEDKKEPGKDNKKEPDLKKEDKKEPEERKKDDDKKDPAKDDKKDDPNKDDPKSDDNKAAQADGAGYSPVAFVQEAQPDATKPADAPPDAQGPRGQERLRKALMDLLEKKYAPGDYDLVNRVSTHAIKLLDYPVPAFQNFLTLGAGIDEVLITDARYALDGSLQLEGWLGQAVAKSAADHFGKRYNSHPAVSDGKPRAALQGLRTIAWPLDVKAWNKRLSEDNDPLFQQTRLERLYFTYNAKGEPELRAEGYTLAKQPDAKDALKARFIKDWQRDWPETAELAKNALNVDGIHELTLRVAIQRTAQKLGLRQVVIEDIRLAPDGTIRIKAILGSKDDHAALAKLLKEIFRVGDKERPFALDDLRYEDWAARLKVLQRKLATDADPAMHTVRLDDIYFVLTDKDGLEARFTGAGLDPPFGASGKQVADRLKKELLLLAPGLGTWQPFSVSAAEIQAIPRPDTAAQARVGDNKTLDGVRLDEAAAFDAEGKLVLKGIWRNKAQEKELRALLEKVIGPYEPRADQRGVVLQMEVAPTDLLLKDLQKFAATKLEDARVERIFFDKEGKLRLKGIVSSTDDEKKLRAELRRLLKLLPNAKSIQVSGGGMLMVAALQAQPEDVPEPDIKILPSVAKYLRENVVNNKEPRWDGVLIDRGTYDEDGQYILFGLLDSPEQKEMINEALKEMAEQPEWRDQLKAGSNLDKMVVMPVQPMLKALRQGQPDFQELDRLRFERAFHDANRTLVITAFSTGANQAKAKTLVEDLIKANPEWKKRAANGVKLELTAVPRNEEMANFALNKAITLLQDNLPGTLDQGPQVRYEWAYWGCTPVVVAKEVPATAKKIESPIPPQNVLAEARLYLDVVLFHNPDDITAWWLRGATALAMGERVAAERDFRRTAPEINFPQIRQARLEKLQNIQGPFRTNATFIADRSVVIAAGGRRAPTLAEIVADNGKQ